MRSRNSLTRAGVLLFSLTRAGVEYGIEGRIERARKSKLLRVEVDDQAEIPSVDDSGISQLIKKENEVIENDTHQIDKLLREDGGHRSYPKLGSYPEIDEVLLKGANRKHENNGFVSTETEASQINNVSETGASQINNVSDDDDDDLEDDDLGDDTDTHEDSGFDRSFLASNRTYNQTDSDSLVSTDASRIYDPIYDPMDELPDSLRANWRYVGASFNSVSWRPTLAELCLSVKRIKRWPQLTDKNQSPATEGANIFCAKQQHLYGGAPDDCHTTFRVPCGLYSTKTPRPVIAARRKEILENPAAWFKEKKILENPRNIMFIGEDRYYYYAFYLDPNTRWDTVGLGHVDTRDLYGNCASYAGQTPVTSSTQSQYSTSKSNRPHSNTPSLLLYNNDVDEDRDTQYRSLPIDMMSDTDGFGVYFPKYAVDNWIALKQIKDMWPDTNKSNVGDMGSMLGVGEIGKEDEEMRLERQNREQFCGVVGTFEFSVFYPQIYTKNIWCGENLKNNLEKIPWKKLPAHFEKMTEELKTMGSSVSRMREQLVWDQKRELQVGFHNFLERFLRPKKKNKSGGSDETGNKSTMSPQERWQAEVLKKLQNNNGGASTGGASTGAAEEESLLEDKSLLEDTSQKNSFPVPDFPGAPSLPKKEEPQWPSILKNSDCTVTDEKKKFEEIFPEYLEQFRKSGREDPGYTRVIHRVEVLFPPEWTMEDLSCLLENNNPQNSLLENLENNNPQNSLLENLENNNPQSANQSQIQQTQTQTSDNTSDKELTGDNNSCLHDLQEYLIDQPIKFMTVRYNLFKSDLIPPAAKCKTFPSSSGETLSV